MLFSTVSAVIKMASLIFSDSALRVTLVCNKLGLLIAMRYKRGGTGFEDYRTVMLMT